jgi:hypothetical protein
MEKVLTVLVQVPSIDSANSSVSFGPRSVAMDLCTKPGDDSASGKRFRLLLATTGDLDVKSCRFDVADKNMVVVLFKAPPTADSPVFWEPPFQEPPPSELLSSAFPAVSQKKKSKARKDSSTEADLSAVKAAEKQVAASHDALERAAASRSAAMSNPVRSAAGMTSVLPETPAALNRDKGQDPMSVASDASSATEGGSGIAPTTFQNSFMFELD